jgi:hypothetical protein
MIGRLALIFVLAVLASATPHAALPRLASDLSRVTVTASDEAGSSGGDGGQDVAPQPSLFRSESELVTVDVVVLDKHGNPVRDLAQTDFTIAEDGRSQVVRFFQPVVTRAAEQRPASSGERSYGYSTNVGAQARPERSFVMFFDDVHLTEEQGERAKTAIERFLNDEAGAGDLVSLVAPGRGLRWHARLPDGRAELIKVLASLHGSVRPEPAQEYISDYEAYRIHVMQDELMAERVGRRFSNYHVFGRDQVNTQTDRRADRAARAVSRSRGVRACHRAESRDPRCARVNLRIHGGGARPQSHHPLFSWIHPRPGAAAVPTGG